MSNEQELLKLAEKLNSETWNTSLKLTMSKEHNLHTYWKT